MERRHRDRAVHLLFFAGLIGKGIDGVLEVVGGIVLFLVSPDRLTGILRVLTQHELSEDPHDVAARLLLLAVQHFSVDAELFAALFLLWHGVVKVGLVWALLRRHLWAYPVAIGAFGLFLVYQGYRYTHTHSPWLLALSGLDLFVIVLTWLEYQRLHAA